MSSVGRWVDRLFNKHKFVRRVMVFWAMSLITWVIWVVFDGPNEITGHVVTALSIVVGLLATVLGFYKWQRAHDKVEREDDCTDADMGDS